MPGQPTEQEMALLYLLYLARDYIDDYGILPAHGAMHAQISATLAAVGDEDFWWQYHCDHFEATASPLSVAQEARNER